MNMKSCYIVLVYNELEYTKKTFESIRQQNQEKYKFDIVCVDNASDAKFAEPLKKYCTQNNIRYLRHDINDGYAGGNNFAFDIMKNEGYDFVFIANNDIELLNSDITSEILKTMEQDKNIAILGCHLIDANDNKIKYSSFYTFIMKYEKINATQNKKVIAVPSVVGCFFCIRCKSLKRNFLFNKDFFMYSEEQDLEYFEMMQGFNVAVLANKEMIVKHYGGFFDFSTAKNWAIYLNIRNSVLTFRNFHSLNRKIYIILYFVLILKLSLKFKKKIILKGFFSGLKFLKNKKNLYDDSIKSLKGK